MILHACNTSTREVEEEDWEFMTILRRNLSSRSAWATRPILKREQTPTCESSSLNKRKQRNVFVAYKVFLNHVLRAQTQKQNYSDGFKLINSKGLGSLEDTVTSSRMGKDIRDKDSDSTRNLYLAIQDL